MYDGQQLIAALIAAAMTLIGSVAKYAYTSSKNVPIRNHIVISAFAGAMMYLLGIQQGWSLPLVGMCCGLAGWHGASIIRRINPPGVNINGDDDGRKQ
ncbi:hypothetical protein [Dickeya poaceiphila]|uniref:Holin n=1 Tax=Dickeya poaceiphila TaxID=568768 RepID=A0A5B8HK21_9GAMM|nr:hypothetical protein [Dickeya poaceiphila]QDX29539.1 holin [Dickeya poaceiphila]